MDASAKNAPEWCQFRIAFTDLLRKVNREVTKKVFARPCVKADITEPEGGLRLRVLNLNPAQTRAVEVH